MQLGLHGFLATLRHILTDSDLPDLRPRRSWRTTNPACCLAGPVGYSGQYPSCRLSPRLQRLSSDLASGIPAAVKEFDLDGSENDSTRALVEASPTVPIDPRIPRFGAAARTPEIHGWRMCCFVSPRAATSPGWCDHRGIGSSRNGMVAAFDLAESQDYAAQTLC